MMALGFTTRTTIKAVGTSAVLVIALGVLYGIAGLDIQPWWMKLVLGAPPAAIIFGGVAWVVSGGEQGTHIEVAEGNRRLSITNANIFAQSLARAALEAFSRAALPPASGAIGAGSPADPANIIEGSASLPPNVEVSERPIDVPPDAGQLK